MHKLRALLRPSTPSPSDETTAHHSNINAQYSTFNSIGGHQINAAHVHVHPSTGTLTSSSLALPSNVAPFNDAPIDQLSVHFTGRQKELALIAQAFMKHRDRDIPPRCVLFGNQGVGKSQLTYAWANSTYIQKENSYILWISATTVEKLHQGFSRLLRFINHPDRSHPEDGVRLEAARRWFEGVKTGNWLLVLDNVFPETLEFLRQNLPRQNGCGTILFTTRTERVALALASTAGRQHDVVEVPLLDVKAGVELFCGHFESGTMDPSSAKIETIVMAVGCLPLAISHAAWYMKESHSSLDDMLALYQSRHKIDVINWEHTLSEYEHKSVAATFTFQIQDLEQHHPDASKLLHVLAFFDAESISLEMLITGARSIVEAPEQPPRSPLAASLLALIQSPISRQNAIAQLQARCLVTYHAGSQSPTFRIHELIQLVVLENTRKSGLNQEFFEVALQLVYATLNEIQEFSSPQWWPRCELVVPHIQALTVRQDTSSTSKKALLQTNDLWALYLSARGRYAEAENLFENIKAEREQLFGLNDFDTLGTMYNLAWVCSRRGRSGEAETLLEQVVDSWKIQLGPKHRDTLKAMYRLADVYDDQQRFGNAEMLFKQTLQSQESQFGMEDNDTLWTMNSLASVYNAQQRYDEAESLLTRVLQARETRLGSEHADTLKTKHVLANVYDSQEQYDAAAALFEQVLHASERLFGSQHPDTLITMYSLARVYAAQRRYGEAEKLLLSVLGAREQILGPSHPRTRNASQVLAWVYQRMGRLDEARMLEQRLSSPLS